MTKLEKYADLLVRAGANVQPGQALVIMCPVSQYEFCRLCVAAAYRAGASEVCIRWNDSVIDREKMLYASDKAIDTSRPWEGEILNIMTLEGAAFISFSSPDPESLADADPVRIRRSTAAREAGMRTYRDYQAVDHIQWCVASVPNPAWAKKVFPALSEADAMDALWNVIFDVNFVGEDNDPVKAWAEHDAEMKRRAGILNSYNFKSMRYTNSLGTDLSFELPENHFWAGAGSQCNGVPFFPNMPTAEIFSAVKRDTVNGVVYSSKPVVIGGNIVDNFHFVLKDGKIVEVHAEKGQQLLEDAIKLDEGASYLGEVALVPYNSPISLSGLLFYCTLFDENAACHFAFGNAYASVRGADKMTAEEWLAAGLNRSNTHVDFMIGTSDLSIIGTTHDGKEVPVFVDGCFTF